MKVVMSKTTCDFIARELDAQHAAEAAIQVLAERVKGLGRCRAWWMRRGASEQRTIRRARHTLTSTGGHEIIARLPVQLKPKEGKMPTQPSCCNGAIASSQGRPHREEPVTSC